ncbi:Rrf2 family transcriptional regulator [Raineyella sp.]|uniref:RrF2 family transcriptional regulator n=1 Tax=Raineyella sp. TaxID=1911550 RepID=UPI002B212A85|nr:Rrf2 family transcriptional regulator [Raineyella sp.]MEA5155786.1 Rrf2 family transcriptional regulator [Raineyella sp.]
MNLSARTEYAVRAMVHLATADPSEPVTLDSVTQQEDLPRKFMEAIFADLRRGGLITSLRGSRGGYFLARGADEITIGDIMRTVDGPLWEVRGLRPQDTEYRGATQHLPTLWVAVRASLRAVLDSTTLAQLASGHFNQLVTDLTTGGEAWANH